MVNPGDEVVIDRERRVEEGRYRYVVADEPTASNSIHMSCVDLGHVKASNEDSDHKVKCEVKSGYIAIT